MPNIKNSSRSDIHILFKSQDVHMWKESFRTTKSSWVWGSGKGSRSESKLGRVYKLRQAVKKRDLGLDQRVVKLNL